MPSDGSNRPACYVASPCGFAPSTQLWYETVLLALVGAHAEVLDPWSVGVEQITAATDPQERLALWHALGESHFRMIAERADLLVAVLDQEPPDNGTVAEVAWAAAHRIPVLAYRGDIRSSGEPELPYNLMIGAAVRISAGSEVSSLAALEAELQRLVAGLTARGGLK